MNLLWPIAGLGILALIAKKKGSYEVIQPEAKAEHWVEWNWPVPITGKRPPVISDGFSAAIWFDSQGKKHRQHSGADIMFRKLPSDPPGTIPHTATKMFIAPPGTAVIAAGPGKIWSVGKSERGLNILVDHGNVKGFGPLTTWYQHLQSFSQAWKKGDVVKPGDVLGLMGYSMLDGEQLRHLHFEMRYPVKSIDPAPYMRFWKKISPGVYS